MRLIACAIIRCAAFDLTAKVVLPKDRVVLRGSVHLASSANSSCFLPMFRSKESYPFAKSKAWAVHGIVEAGSKCILWKGAMGCIVQVPGTPTSHPSIGGGLQGRKLSGVLYGVQSCIVDKHRLRYRLAVHHAVAQGRHL